jgi:Golgi apparatus protein 1
MRAALLALVLGAHLILASAADDATAAATVKKEAPKISNIIPTAGSAELYNGIGDVSATGELRSMLDLPGGRYG